jgi:hypothetical protein
MTSINVSGMVVQVVKNIYLNRFMTMRDKTQTSIAKMNTFNRLGVVQSYPVAKS